MKKLVCAVLAIILSISTFALFSCDKTNDDPNHYKVGILQQLDHVALDSANQGFRDELTRLMTEAGKTVEFNNKNANNDSSTMSTIANTLISSKCDLILSIATNASKTLKGANYDTNIPTLFTAVTAPANEGLVDSLEVPGGNMTGTSDLNPVQKQFELLQLLVPNLKTLGIVYTTSEDNSVFQKNLLQAACDAAGVTLVVKGISDASDISSAVAALNISGVQAIYLPTDNLLANAAAAIHNYNLEGARLPIVCGEESMNSLCGIATYSINYYNLGVQTAQMAFDILVNGKSTATLPVQLYSKASELTINETIASAIGFTIPQSVYDLLAD